MSSRLVKVEGAGNDFLLGTGAWAQRLSEEPDLVIRLCNRRRGIGADGTLAVFVEADNAIRLVHRNADGSASAFCANGSRCAARAAVELLGLPTNVLVITGWVEIPAIVRGAEVSLELPPPTAPVDRTLETDYGLWRGRHLELGTPHLVLFVDEIDTLAIATVAPALRRHPGLGPNGANVHFVERHSDPLRLRSFERGVEAETLCCGSGVVVSALLALESSGADSIVVEPRSGDRLKVEALGQAPEARSLLTGPARMVAEIDILDRLD